METTASMLRARGFDAHPGDLSPNATHVLFPNHRAYVLDLGHGFYSVSVTTTTRPARRVAVREGITLTDLWAELLAY